jgi:outer membrane protein TolC
VNFKYLLLACTVPTLAAGIAVGFEVQPDRILTLEDSVRLALSNSPAILSSREDVEIALQRVRQSESLFFPKLDLSANWSKFRVEEANLPLLLQPALGPTLIASSPRENFYTARANIYQTVYEGGRSRDLWRQARISYERARNISDSLQTLVASRAKKAYYDLLFAQEKARQYLELSQRLQGRIQEGARASSPLDRLKLENEVDAVRACAAQAQADEEQQRLAYLHALNLELNTTVALKGDLTTQPKEINLQEMLAWATQYRAELRQTEYQEELSSLGISLSQAERTPVVAFGASYERNGNDLGTLSTDWAGTLNVSLPVSISDMFYGWAKIRENKAQYRQAALKYAETSDQVQWQVRQAYSDYRFWQNELTPRQQEYQRLQGLVAALRQRGTTELDRAQAEQMVVDAHLRYEEAVHGHLVAIADLETAVGHSVGTEQ